MAALAALGQPGGTRDLPPVLCRVQDKKQAVPDVNAQKQAEKAIKSIYTDEYKARDSQKRIEFAEKLLNQADDTKEWVDKYVLLREARDIAAEADVGVAFAAIDKLADAFDIKPVEMKRDVLGKARSNVRTPEAAGKLAEAGLRVVQETVQHGDYENATKILQDVKTLADASKNPSYMQKAKDWAKDIPEWKREHREASTAELALSADPNDADAQLKVGRFQLLYKGDYGAFINLSKGSDPALKEIAEQELAKPAGAEAQADLADKWDNLYQKERTPRAKRAYGARARHWYEESFKNGLGGLAAAKARKRLEELGKVEAVSKGYVDLLKMIDPKNDAVRGEWRVQAGKLLIGNAPAFSGLETWPSS